MGNYHFLFTGKRKEQIGKVKENGGTVEGGNGVRLMLKIISIGRLVHQETSD